MDREKGTKGNSLPVVEKAELRRIGLHTLRHTYTSLLINAGESIKYVSRQLGHASIQITADLYGHLFKETSLAAMTRLGQRIPEREKRTTSESPSNSHLTDQAKTAKNTVEQHR